ncbi:MAG TPA: hypothetical protein VN915_10550 [Elusimicrobiota bacterium]|nr:hypothetical protein [Elusimicrobiota bacterium]
MNITTSRRALFLLLAVLSLAAGRAAAEDDGRIRLEGPSWAPYARGSYLLTPCPSSRERGLAFCLGGDDAPPSPAAKRFTRFTRLAGMFMGRVEALSLGDWRVRFILDLR